MLDGGFTISSHKRRKGKVIMNIYIKYYLSNLKKIKRAISKFKISKEDKEDILQDLYLSLCSIKEQSHPNLGGYITTSAKNLVREKLRRDKKTTNDTPLYLFEPSQNTIQKYNHRVSETPDQLKELNNPETLYISKEFDNNRNIIMGKFYNTLGEKSKILFKDYVNNKYNTIGELANAYGRNENSTKHLIFLARRSLERYVKDKLYENKTK